MGGLGQESAMGPCKLLAGSDIKALIEGKRSRRVSQCETTA